MDYTRRISARGTAYGERGPDGGFSLPEVLVSLGLFALIAVGALGVLGSVEAGGPLAAMPTAIGAIRLAKDHTAASVYLQSVQEFLTARTARQTLPGVYCQGDGCPPTDPLPARLLDIPAPPSTASQLSRPRLLVIIERWHWDATAEGRYCRVGSAGCGASPSGEYLTRVTSTLTWDFKGRARSVTLARFIP